MRASTNKNNFTSGELSPLLNGRDDLEVYHKGLQESQNMRTMRQGGITRREGTRYVNEVKDSAEKTRIIPFVFSDNVAYILEFSDLAVRIYKGTALQSLGAVVNQLVNTSFNTDITSWVDASIDPGFGNQIAWHGASQSMEFQTNRVIASTGRAIAQQYVATATIGKDYRLIYTITDDSQAFGTMTARFGRTTGGTEYEEIITTLDGNNQAIVSGDQTAATSTTIGVEFEYSGAAGSFLKAYIDEVYIYELTTTFELVTPFLENELFELQFAQSNDVMWITHKNHPPQRLYRTSDTDWFIADEVFEHGPFEPLTLKASDLVTQGALITGGSTWKADETGLTVDTGSSGMDSTDYDGELFYMVDENDPANSAVMELGAWSANTTFTACISKTDIPTSLRASTNYTRLWARQAWNAFGRGYPKAVGLYEQRLLFASSDLNQQTVWGSSSGGFTYFRPGIEDDDSVTFTLTGKKQNPILWISEVANLILGGLAGEWGAKGGGLGDPITPSNVIPRLATKRGSSSVSPSDIGDDIAFVQRTGHRIFALVNNDDSLYHNTIDLTMLAEHLTAFDSIKQMAFQRERDSLLFAVRGDGVLLVCTYDRDNNVLAWGRYVTDGIVESVAVIPQSTADQVWIVVKRDINGSDVRYLEHFEEVDWRILEAPYYLDSGITYNGASTTSITGLDHLEGEEVSVYAAGESVGDFTVASGAITLDKAVTECEVGLNYSSKIKEMPEPAKSPDGSSQGRQKRKPRVAVRLYKTQALKVNDDIIDLPRDASTTKPELFTGIIDDSQLGWDKDAANTIESVGPNPLTILSIDSTTLVGNE